MLIVRLDTEDNGARANQIVYPAFDTVPEGWVQIPQALEDRALELLPWMGLEVQDGAVVGIYDDVASRAAAAVPPGENDGGDQDGQAPAHKNQSGDTDPDPE